MAHVLDGEPVSTSPEHALRDATEESLMHVKEEFGWSIAERQHSPVVVAFLRSVQGKDISEDEFAQKYAALSRTGKLHASRTRSPSKARGIYRSLRTKFDFFA